MADDDQQQQQNHIVIFPFMALGHTIPLLHLASFLIEQKSIAITLITTPANAADLRRRRLLNPSINIYLLPFPSSSLLPLNCESTDRLPSMDMFPLFFQVASELQPSFETFFSNLSPRPLCLISDFFLYWTFPVCARRRVPRLVFNGMSPFSTFCSKALWTRGTVTHDASEQDCDGQSFTLAGSPDPELKFTESDIPTAIKIMIKGTNTLTPFMVKAGEAELNSWGAIMNSFLDLDGDYVKPLQSFYRSGFHVWLIGPMSLLSTDIDHVTEKEEEEDDDECLKWLDSKPERSVLYIAFGTQAHLTEKQVKQIAGGLESSKCKYLWVLRENVPQLSTITERGKIVKWAPQATVLKHRAVGGFLSHCGWNSCLESFSAGVPILTWPLIAEQKFNAKFIADVVGVGFRITEAAVVGEREVSSKEIEVAVRELMEGERGKRAREKALEIRKRAVAATLEENGSSRKSIHELLQKLREVAGERKKHVDVESTDGHC